MAQLDTHWRGILEGPGLLLSPFHPFLPTSGVSKKGMNIHAHDKPSSSFSKYMYVCILRVAIHIIYTACVNIIIIHNSVIREND